MALRSLALFLLLTATVLGQSFVASRLHPNLADNIDRPLRYRPQNGAFVITNGTETFNRPLYGGNTAFRVDGGDRPEFVLYLPGRGGNLRLALHTVSETKWLHEAATIVTRYEPGVLAYEIRDPLLGARGVLRVTAVALYQTEGFMVRATASDADAGLELAWAYGGVSGERGKRDGDIGTESVPISEWFQLKPAFCQNNTFELGSASFVVRAKPATIVGVMPAGAVLAVGDASHWSDAAALFRSGTGPASAPVLIGRVPVGAAPLHLLLQRVAADAVLAQDLDTYRAVTAAPPPREAAPKSPGLRPAYAARELPEIFEQTLRHFSALRRRVEVATPDPFLDAAVGALNVAADAVWDEPQQAIMHGAIAWRTKLLGWRGPYLLTALGWHERARQHFRYWAGRQNTKPIPDKLPPADENANLARNETGLHSNGDLSNSHYDMNLVYIDALFRHLAWTGDLELARELWPVIERHLAWERRLFRREFGPNQLPLYEAYAAIWASDDLQYHGGGTMHASAYNYFHNRQAARLARALKVDPSPYEREAQLLERGMREHLWVPEGWFAESKDLLGLQRVHRSAALWTFYHAMDSDVPTPQEAWQMTRQVEAQIPHLPVRGPGVPEGLYTLATTNWLPYDWSINNVVMAEVAHTALGFWQAGRPDEAWRMLKGSLLAAMYMGIAPGNVGSMSYLDVYRRESQRDFADGSGVLSRAVIEGIFGVTPDALAGELRVAPGWPAVWERASVRHPDFALGFTRAADADTYGIEQHFPRTQSMRLRLIAPRERVAEVTVNGGPVRWHRVENSVGVPRIEILAPAARRHEVVVRWAGAVIQAESREPSAGRIAVLQQGEMKWLAPPRMPEAERGVAAMAPVPAGPYETVELTRAFNDRVTQIFRNEYRAPRSPFVSLALPKQGIGGWAGGVNATAEIDDAGLRAAARTNGGRIVVPAGLPFATPGETDAKNVIFTSQWDNYPREVSVPLAGRARQVALLMAGSTNHMQSRFDNGEVVVTYADGTTATLVLENPTTWWPIEEDYFIDDFQFRVDATPPIRVDLKTAQVRVLSAESFKGRGGKVPGGAATVLQLPLDPGKDLKTLTVRALANEVVIGLMAATLAR
jgi:hypothetical protein